MPPVTFLVLGATGPTGLEFCKAALAAGHSLMIFARSPDKLPADIKDSAAVKIIQGELSSTTELAPLLQCGADILVSFAGPTSGHQGTPVADFYSAFLPSLPDAGIHRALILATPSAQDPKDKGGFKWWASVTLIKTLVNAAYQEMVGIGQVVASQPVEKLQWTLFRVGWLNNGPAKPVNATYTGSGQDSMVISRASIVEWVLREATEKKFVGQRPYISN
ncbi:Hypothetical protein D9617_2g054150 [Elsinoe fawcettii]|nr:Hypothetical protein D9617_2g054150 [Elsinoe fawcettii]